MKLPVSRTSRPEVPTVSLAIAEAARTRVIEHHT